MKHIETLSTEESHELLHHFLRHRCTWSKSIKGHRNYLIILLMLDAGMRVGEVVQLKIGDLLINSLPVKSIRIRAEIAKNKHERVIPASERLTDAIKLVQRHLWPPNIKTMQDYAFTTGKTGLPITRRQIQSMVATESLKSIKKPINPHLLRHTFATRLMRVTSTAVVQQMLGHKSIKTTQIYMHPSEDDRQKAINALLWTVWNLCEKTVRTGRQPSRPVFSVSKSQSC